MTRKSESLRLKKIAVESGGYVAKPCSVCGWWKLESGDREGFERDYLTDIRCKCVPGPHKSKGGIETNGRHKGKTGTLPSDRAT